MPATVRVSLVLRQETGRKTVNRMLPVFRFVIGATLAVVVLAVTSFGLFMAVHVAHQPKVGPLEASRSPVFDDRADWNQFYDPAVARRFEERARKADPREAAVQRAADSLPDAAPPQTAQNPQAQIEPRGDDRAGENAAPVPNAPSDVALAPPTAPPSTAAPAPAEPAAAASSEPPSPAVLATPVVPSPSVAATPAADEPNETGALPPAATPPVRDQEPNAVVTGEPPATTRTATAPPAEPEIAKTPETPVTLAPPLPTPKPAAASPRKPKTVARDSDDEDTPVRRPAPKPRTVRPAQQTVQQPLTSDQQYWRQQQQYTPQQRQQRQADPFAQQPTWR